MRTSIRTYYAENVMSIITQYGGKGAIDEERSKEISR